MRLPKAPLVEVVFELHWAAQQTGAAGDARFGYDPGFPYFRQMITAALQEFGFSEIEQIPMLGPPILGSIDTRFRKKDSPFPLLQIGPGIIACNLATDYDWHKFEQLCRTTVDQLQKVYPDSEVTPLIPSRLELRYVDFFARDVLKEPTLSGFLDKDTKLKSSIARMLKDLPLEGEDTGRLTLRRKITGAIDSYFEFDVHSSTHPGMGNGILLVSRVICESGVDKIWKENGANAIIDWLQMAHSITSPFFKSFIGKDLMDAFVGERKDGQ